MKRLLAVLLLIAAPAAAQVTYPPSAGGFPGGTITAPILGANGSAAAPTYSFTGDTSSGWYRDLNNLPAVSNAGTKMMSWQAVGLNVYSFGSLRAGSALQYGWSSNADPTLAAADTGLARGTAGRVWVTDGGAGNGVFATASFLGCATSSCATLWTAITSAGLAMDSSRQFLFSGTSSNALAAADTGLARSTAGIVKVTDGSSGGGKIWAGNDGTAGAPTLAIGAGSTRGFYYASGVWFWSNGTTAQFAIGSTAGVNLGSGLQFAWSSNADPSAAGADTGLARVAASVVKPTNGSSTIGWVQDSGNVQITSGSDYTNATATFSNLTNLTVSNLVSGRKYAFMMALFISESTAADGVALDFSAGSSGSTLLLVHCVLTNDTGGSVAQANATSAAFATVINATALSTTNVHLYECSGAFTPNSNGTFIPRARQNTHSTGTLTIKSGSWIKFWDNQ